MKKSEFFLELQRQKMRNQELEREIAKLKQLLEAELQARKNDCHRGNYCSNCKHAVLIGSRGNVTCYCTYGQCKHFEKEMHFNEF